jgi:asparagine synthase (glutamine-hydrolysing)
MCGIAGALGGRHSAERARAMSAALAHRGPDDSGIAELYERGGSLAGVLAQRRLSILDLSQAAHQPMVTDDGRYTLVYNGELYNYRDLRAELLAEGVQFRGDGDTEVLLHGCARHGVEWLRRVHGMYAFVLWDRDAERAILARDPFGIKPLYVYEADGGLLFASEVRAMLASNAVPRRMSRDAVRSFLETGSVIEPHTIIEGVWAVPAGTAIEVDVRDGMARLSAPRSFASHRPNRVDETVREAGEAARRVAEVLRRSVARHLVSDVPVSFFLSGGIDSSVVVALASELGAPLETFTVSFAEEEFSEAGPARIVAERFGTLHHDIRVSGEALLGDLPAAFAAMDQPTLDGVNTFVISRAVREAGHKVVLSGLGGDELFGGYPSFARARHLRRLGAVPSAFRAVAARGLRRLGGVRAEKVATLLAAADDPARAAYAASRQLFGPGYTALLAGAGKPRPPLEAPRGLSPLQRVSWYETVGYMRNTLLRDSDVFSMAHGLELRVPFVDREVAAVSAQIGDEILLSPGVSKPVLVRALEDRLPREVWDRPKRGFTFPFERWMRGELRGEVDATLTVAGLSAVGLSAEPSRDLWRAFLDGRGAVSWSRPWALYALTRWAAENRVSVDPVETTRSSVVESRRAPAPVRT